MEILLQRLRSGDLSGLTGTDLALELPLSERLVNAALDQRPADGPLQRLSLSFLTNEVASLTLAARLPVIGTVERRIDLHPRGEYQRGTGGLLYLEMTGGLKRVDRALLKLLGGFVEKQLPPGIDLDAERVTVDLPELLRGQGQDALLPALAAAKLGVRPGQLIVFLHLKID